MVKAVFFDIDGTLVSFNTHKIPDSTLEALSLLKKKGIKTFIATGRPYFVIDNLGDLTFDGYITMNGSLCLTGEKETIYKNAIQRQDIEALIHFQNNGYAFPCMVATAEEIFTNYIDENVIEVLKQINFITPVHKSLSEALSKDVYQLMGFFNDNQESEIMSNVLTHCETTRWNPLFTDIIAKGNSKQVGMDKVLGHFSLDLKDTMAFGDGGNDISMLRHAAQGIAMGNASEEVKQSASYITDSVDDNGIWNALKHFGVI